MEPELQTESPITASDLGLSTPEEDDYVEDAPEDVPRETLAEPTAPAVEEDAPPQSWAKEKHEIWKQMHPDAKGYYKAREKQMLDGLEGYKQHNEMGKRFQSVMSPYKDYLRQQNVDEVKAVEYLMNVQYKLSTADNNTKLQMIKDLARGVGVDFDQIYGQNAQNNPNTALEPLLNEIKGIKSEWQAQKDRQYSETRSKVAQTVEQFAADAKNPYFDECAEDIAKFINQGDELPAAYEKAVWANPVTRAKELARIQTESTAKLKPRLREDAQKSQRAISSNVRSRDTGRTPTEPLGTMEDTMRETLAGIKARTH